jgi:IS4 transposase
MSYRRVYTHDKEDGSGVMYDQSVKINNHNAAQDYPLKIRRINYSDADSGKTLIFLTKNFKLKATYIAQLYKVRWKIELLLKWIKHHLKIKYFGGLSGNAVKSQILIAISVHVLVAIANKRFMLKQSLYKIL